MGELLGFMYESCQELGLIKELLKLPLGLSEQVRERSDCSFTLVNINVFFSLQLRFKKRNSSLCACTFFHLFVCLVEKLPLKNCFSAFCFRNVWRSFSRAQGVSRTENC